LVWIREEMEVNDWEGFKLECPNVSSEQALLAVRLSFVSDLRRRASGLGCIVSAFDLSCSDCMGYQSC